MHADELIAGRFRLLERVGQGGMGQVFRAEDLESGRAVALKRMISLEPALVDRFLLEAKTLASLSHPAIVGYVAHGTTASQEPYLVMDWLEGEELGQRLDAGALGLRESWTILRRVAEALAAAHGCGIVHRDLKPANIMLVGGQPEGATLVDFGIARREAIAHNITRTGAIIGTVGYMAPEQLHGVRDIDGRADLFSLGCLAFECLAGRPAFEGASLGAVLGRLLFGESPRLCEAAPTLPAAFDELVAKLLRSDREQRFQSAQEVVAALDVLEPLTLMATAATEQVPLPRRRSVLVAERSPVAMVLVVPTSTPSSAPESLGTTLQATLADQERPSSARVAIDFAAQRVCEHIAKRWGGRVSTLADAMVLVFMQTNAVQERVHRAARAALDVLGSLPSWRVSLVLSHQQGTGRITPASNPASASLVDDSVSHGVVLDASAAAFLGREFTVDQLILTEYVPTRDEPRKVLGRSAPCLGRDKELRLIEGTLDECIDEGTCRALVLRASAGVGKSRIRRELVARVQEQGGVEVLSCRCDVGSASISLGVLRAWITDALGLRERSSTQRYELLRERVLPQLRASAGLSAEQLLELFAELADVSVAEPSSLLLDARADAREMRRCLQLALETWLRARSQAKPLLLVLEDLHWADPASLSLLASAWPALDDAPLLLLVTTWPEGEAAHPGLFALKGAQIVDVGPLGKRASERLVRQLLGDELPAELVGRVIEFAGGNAFLLEELLRHVGAGHPLDSFPGSAIAIVQARLVSLAPEARALLRTASVLGERFDPLALEAMGRSEPSQVGMQAILERLMRDELLLPPSADDQARTGSWAFRHSLVRQAAYELLTDAEREQAHLAAARWFAARSGSDPATVADHFAKANAWTEAVPWFARAIDEREEIGDFEGVSVLARRIDRPEIDPVDRTDFVFRGANADLQLGRLEVLQELDDRVRRGDVARGSPGWAATVLSLLSVKLHMGMQLQACPELAMLDEARAAVRPSLASIFALALLVVSLMHVGAVEEARRTAELLRELTAGPNTPPGWAVIRDAYVPWLLAYQDDPAGLAEHRRGAQTARKHFGALRQQEILVPYALFLVEHGHYEEASSIFAQADALLRQGKEGTEATAAGGWMLAVGITLRAWGPRPVDCRAMLEDQALLHEWKHLAPYIQALGFASSSLADPTRPELAREAMRAIEPLIDECGAMLSTRAAVLTALAECALNAGEPQRALAATDAVFTPPTLLLPGTRARATLSRIRALRALGREHEAIAEAKRARVRLLSFASGLEPRDRDCFVAIPAVAATLELALLADQA